MYQYAQTEYFFVFLMDSDYNTAFMKCCSEGSKQIIIIDLLFHCETFLYYRNYTNTYCLLDELRVLVLHYSNLFHDMNYFLLIPIGMAALRSLMLRLMTIHQISFIFLRQRIVWLVI